MALNGVIAVTLRYFTEFGQPALQKSICSGIYAIVHRVQKKVVYFVFNVTSQIQARFSYNFQ